MVPPPDPRFVTLLALGAATVAFAATFCHLYGQYHLREYWVQTCGEDQSVGELSGKAY